MYGKRDLVEGGGYCEICGEHTENTSYNTRNWEYVWFIPVIPKGPRVRVVNECRQCSYATYIPEKDVLVMLADLRRGLDNALVAILAGQKEFDDDGTMVSCIARLADIIGEIYCLSSEDHARPTLAALEEHGLAYAYHVVNSKLLESKGRQNEAIESYRRAAECEPGEALPLQLLAALYARNNDRENARLVYKKVFELADNKPPV